MTAVTDSRLPRHGRPFTVDDLAAMPEGGYRYELIDGTLLVSPAPGFRHQRAVLKLSAALDAALDAVCPPGMHVLPGPFAVRPSKSLELRPDVLVARSADFTDELLPGSPLLAVEVLSPSTSMIDLNTKKAVYERLGVPSYWVVDPMEPLLIVFELAGGAYEQVAEVKGTEAFEAARPFPVRIVPVELLGTGGGG